GASAFGVKFEQPKIDVDQLRTWKEEVTGKLAQGIVGMCKSSQVEYLIGKASFEDSKTLRVDTGEGTVRLKFKHAILATGSRPTRLNKLFKKPDDIKSPRILDSTSALKIESLPKNFLVIGGGYIGLEMGTVYAALGSQVTVVEMTDGLLPG